MFKCLGGRGGTLSGGERVDSPSVRFYLLNEWLIHRLTGTAIGDTCNQGMGGLWDISKNGWNERALALAGISEHQLACIGQPGQLSAPLSPGMRKRLELPEIPVYSCGNDNAAAAAGVGIDKGEFYCSFGTAMVVYGVTADKVQPTSANQIAGIGPWPETWFLLAVAECGSALDWLAGELYRGHVDRMLEEALDQRINPRLISNLRMNDNGLFDLSNLDLSSDRGQFARAALEYYAERFGDLLGGMSKVLGKPRRLIAGGGLSRSRAWLDLLEQRHCVKLETRSTEHPTLMGVARIIRASRRDD